MKIKHALQEYLLEIEVRKYTPKTIRSYRNNLNLFVRFLGEEAEVFDTDDITLATVRKFSAYMVGRGKKYKFVFPFFSTMMCAIQDTKCPGSEEPGHHIFSTKTAFSETPKTSVMGQKYSLSFF